MTSKNTRHGKTFELNKKDYASLMHAGENSALPSDIILEAQNDTGDKNRCTS